MNREDLQKLLGGYGTGSLTPEEQQALFAAALEDQELFDALGREQALRDLLRDPGNKAELLVALATPARERAGFWGWLRTPLVAGCATAAVAAIALVAVWQGTRGKLAAPAPAIVAEMKAPERNPAEMKAPRATETKDRELKTAKATATRGPGAATGVAADVAPDAATGAATDVAHQTAARRKSELASLRDAKNTKPEMFKGRFEQPVDAPLPSPAPPPPPPAAAVPASQPGAATQTVEVTAETSSLGVKQTVAAGLPEASQLTTLQDKLTLGAATNGRTDLRTDARSLFYGNMFVPGPNALGQLGAGGQSQAGPRSAGATMRAATGNLAKAGSPASTLGVRVSILRGDQEAAVTTVLNPGESVRLKLTPNEDGFLYVATRDGNVWKMVANGPVQRLKPFETPPLPFTGPGTKQLYVMLSRQAQTLTPQALPGMARTNLVETLADQDRATYVVAALGTDAPQQVVQAITLTYR